jgi:hypothetical protein
MGNHMWGNGSCEGLVQNPSEQVAAQACALLGVNSVASQTEVAGSSKRTVDVCWYLIFLVSWGHTQLGVCFWLLLSCCTSAPASLSPSFSSMFPFSIQSESYHLCPMSLPQGPGVGDF